VTGIMLAPPATPRSSSTLRAWAFFGTGASRCEEWFAPKPTAVKRCGSGKVQKAFTKGLTGAVSVSNFVQSPRPASVARRGRTMEDGRAGEMDEQVSR